VSIKLFYSVSLSSGIGSENQNCEGQNMEEFFEVGMVLIYSLFVICLLKKRTPILPSILPLEFINIQENAFSYTNWFRPNRGPYFFGNKGGMELG
jgi:hypothetical protein